MRFQKALTHELPSADSRCHAVLTRLSSRPLFVATATLPARAAIACATLFDGPKPTVVEDSSNWRFAAEWRRKEILKFAPVHERKRLFQLLGAGFAAIALLLSAGCKTGTSVPQYAQIVDASQLKHANLKMVSMTNALDPAYLRAPTNLFTLGPGDKIDIEEMDETNSLTTTVVGPDGKVYFGLLPGLDVWGLTLGQTRELIENGLSKYVRGQPQVNVTLRDVQSKHVWLLGRFQQPGVYNMSSPTTVLEAIATAGGSQSFAGQRQISEGGPIGEDLADFQHSFLVRDGRMVPVDFYALLDKGDMSQNVYLKPDDFIYFAPAYAKEVYVLGAVTQPKPVQYVEGMTLLQAISGAYGTIRDAYLAHVTIIRGSLTHPQIAVVNYYDIVKGHAPDVELEPHDIVYIPLTPYRYLRKYLDTALDTFVTSVAINEGSPSGSISGVTIPAGGGGVVTTPVPVPPVGSH